MKKAIVTDRSNGVPMKTETIIRLARQAGLFGDNDVSPVYSDLENVQIFACLLAEHEKEKYAQLCEEFGEIWREDGKKQKSLGAIACADHIRNCILLSDEDTVDAPAQ